MLAINNNYSNTYNNNINFKAVKIRPSIDSWNNDILQAALKSKTIRKIIKKDKQNGKDTIMELIYPDVGSWEQHKVAFKVNDEIKITTYSWYSLAPAREDMLGEIAKLDRKDTLAETLRKFQKQFGKIKTASDEDLKNIK